MRKRAIAIVGAAAWASARGVPAQAQSASGMTLEQVDPSKPFGDIDVTLTMLDPRTIEAWAGGLKEDRQAELRDRCEFMLEHEARYDIAPRTICRKLLGRESVPEGGPAPPSAPGPRGRRDAP